MALKPLGDRVIVKADEAEALRQQVANLTTERDSLKEANAQKDTRIAELEALADGQTANDDEPLPAMHNGNPAKPDDDWKEPTDEESAAYCRQVLQGEI